MNFDQKFFIGPMSKQIVDCLLDQDCNTFAFIPSRRQVDVDYGYVNNWRTDSFSKYIKDRKSNFIICRDHSGPNQGHKYDDGLHSLDEDCKFLDIIHIDPFKNSSTFSDAISQTLNLINFCLSKNENMFFEVGTEEAIFKYEAEELFVLLNTLKAELKDNFTKIKFAVIQSGTKLQNTCQKGEYDECRLARMIEVCKEFNLKSKEHNGDYLPLEIIKNKFAAGLDSINIAPEFGVCQTETILDCISDDDKEFYWKVCLESSFWHKWVDSSFDPYTNKLELIKICGHYMFTNSRFAERIDISKYKDEIANNLNFKINAMLSIID